MKFSQITSITFFCLFLFAQLSAQPWGKNTRKQMIETGQESEAAGDIVNAITWYEKAYDEERNKDLAVKLAELNYMIRDYKRSDSWYKRVLSRDKENLYKEARFGYAKMLKDDGRYNEAIEQFGQFMNDTENEELLERSKHELQGIQLLNDIEQNIDIIVTNLGKNVNSGSGDFSPREHLDGTLYFGSYDRKNEIVMDGSEDDFHAKIFSTVRGDEGFGKKKNLGITVNRKQHHNSNLAFSRDGKVMYFTRTKMSGIDIVSSEIFYSIRTDDGWTPGDPVTGINGDYIVTQPAMGELFGSEVIFFVSDMDGGLGGKDIYYATKKDDGEFSSPVNLGEGINTPANEITPYYFNGTLYFSSDGHKSIGGYDINSTKWDGSEWSEISNMGLNFNTAYDDLYYSLSDDGSRGYLVSNRPDKEKRRLRSETCCDDIYGFNSRELVIDLLATVFDSDGDLSGSTMQLVNMTDSIGFPSLSKEAPLGNSHNFLLEQNHEYIAVASKEGYYPDTIEFNTAGILDDYTVEKSFTLNKKPVKTVPTTPVDSGPKTETQIVTINEAIRLNNIYYDFDDAKILPDAEQDLYLLLDLMNKYPDMVIELSSHTDAQGVSTYNRKLSQQRAQSAVDWMANKGVSLERMKPVGYGEDVILNHCTNGVRCSDDEHRLNRRTEFKIIAGPQTIEITREIKTPTQSGKQSFGLGAPVPVMDIINNNQDLGVMKKGESVEFEFLFTNSGVVDLKIDLITGCNCFVADWPKEPIPPGQNGRFKVLFDSSDMKTGEINKVLDIIANTDPIVVEAFFKVTILE